MQSFVRNKNEKSTNAIWLLKIAKPAVTVSAKQYKYTIRATSMESLSLYPPAFEAHRHRWLNKSLNVCGTLVFTVALSFFIKWMLFLSVRFAVWSKNTSSPDENDSFVS